MNLQSLIQRLFMNRKTKYDEMSGVVVSINKNNVKKCYLLNSEGHLLSILNDYKYKQFKDKVGQCVHLVGHILVTSKVSVFKILYIYNEFERISLIDETDQKDCSDISSDLFVDYESIYT